MRLQIGPASSGPPSQVLVAIKAPEMRALPTVFAPREYVPSVLCLRLPHTVFFLNRRVSLFTKVKK